MNKSLIIRDATINDYYRINDFENEFFMNDGPPLTTADFQNLLQSSEKVVLVAQFDDKVIGSLRFTINGSIGLINRLVVAKEYQNRGIGFSLLSEIISRGREKRIHKIRLYTLRDNQIAVNLYKKAGFKIIRNFWHFIIPIERTQEPHYDNDFYCENLQLNEIPIISDKYRLNSDETTRYFHDPDHHCLTLKKNKVIVGYCRFNPKFPGAMPFIIEEIKSFDIFIKKLIELTNRKEHNQLHITFSDNEELKETCLNRGYKLHHSLYLMELNLQCEKNYNLSSYQ